MSTKRLHLFLWIYIVTMFFISSYIYGIVLKANGDNVEHLHTSWMVWQGYLPYKDFFQHHNPLTWYLSAPFVAYLIDDENIFSIFNIVGIITLYFIAYYHYKLFMLNQENKSAAMILFAVLIGAYSLLWSTDYRPDTFMYLFFYIGLYYLFLYTKTQKHTALIVSFLSFFISFMFTQKVLLHLIIPGLFLIYWICRGKIKLIHLFYATILPLLFLMIFIGYLYQNGALEIYWRSNYPFNTYIPKIFDEQRIIFPPKEYIDFYIFLPIAGISSFYYIYKGSDLERMLSLTFWFETALRMLYFSAFLHYVIYWLMTAIMLGVMFLSRFTKYKTVICWLSVVYLLFMAFYHYQTTYKKEIVKQDTMNGHELAFNILTPCDYALNGYYSTYNLKAKDPGFYSILLGQIDVLGEKAGIAKKDNLNDLIRETMPKIIYGNVYWDTYWEQRGKKIPAHKIDNYLLNTYYKYSGIGNLYVLKPQYQRHGCVYNGKEWRFMD